jgi:hypothetical protein
MSPAPVRVLRKTILVPSGDHDAPWSLPIAVMSGALSLPSGLIVQMSKLPPVCSV